MIFEAPGGHMYIYPEDRKIDIYGDPDWLVLHRKLSDWLDTPEGIVYPVITMRYSDRSFGLNRQWNIDWYRKPDPYETDFDVSYFSFAMQPEGMI